MVFSPLREKNSSVIPKKFDSGSNLLRRKFCVSFQRLSRKLRWNTFKRTRKFLAWRPMDDTGHLRYPPLEMVNFQVEPFSPKFSITVNGPSWNHCWPQMCAMGSPWPLESVMTLGVLYWSLSTVGLSFCWHIQYANDNLGDRRKRRRASMQLENSELISSNKFAETFESR